MIIPILQVGKPISQFVNDLLFLCTSLSHSQKYKANGSIHSMGNFSTFCPGNISISFEDWNADIHMWLNTSHVETLHRVKTEGEVLTNWSFMNGKEWNVSYLIHKTSERMNEK